MSGDVRICRLLVENQARIDAVNSDQATALHRAAALNKVEVVKFLVDRWVAPCQPWLSLTPEATWIFVGQSQ